MVLVVDDLGEEILIGLFNCLCLTLYGDETVRIETFVGIVFSCYQRYLQGYTDEAADENAAISLTGLYYKGLGIGFNISDQ
ncbi:MAG: hypothetical protein EZS28_011722 [Streblomastix strix]|uniref:Uncharacterized protein n=1 Tax=Streblomastix strix TaxID=222440 RepID=A0A5J4WDL5_9EUKA|nr:MAG: hypothetical protein EZS28_011722 [Streblomastix strix]